MKKLDKRQRKQIKTYGHLYHTFREKNEVFMKKNIVKIYLYKKQKKGKGRKKIAETILDIDDFLKIPSGIHFHLSWNGYAIAEIKRKKTRLHNLIMPKKNGFDTDHINENKLDNRKKNLRYLTRSENVVNQKRIIGFRKIGNKYVARIVVDRKPIILGRFNTKKEARMARIEAEKKYYPALFKKSKVELSTLTT